MTKLKNHFERQFFHNIMKPRKLLTEIMGQGALRKQRSEIINTKYLTSHESTSFCGQFQSSIDHFSSISLTDCFEELNSHVTENRPLRPAFVVQIKKILNQAKRYEREGREDVENKRKSKESVGEEKFLIRSPYIVNRSLKKFKPAFAESEATEILRKTLKKRKINFESGETQTANKSKKQSQKAQCKVFQQMLEIKHHFANLSEEVKQLKNQYSSQLLNIKSFVSSQLQGLKEIASNSIKMCMSVMRKQWSKRQLCLSQTVSQLEEKACQAEQRQRVLREYLNQRETQLITSWTAFHLRPT